MRKHLVLFSIMFITFLLIGCQLVTTSAVSSTLTASSASTTASDPTTTTTTTTASNTTDTTGIDIKLEDEIVGIMEDFDLNDIAYDQPTQSFELHSTISNNVLFQQNKPIKIKGKAEANTLVLVKLVKNNQPSLSYLAYALANDEAEFIVELPALQASYDEYTLVISDTVHETVVEKVLIGEVWVAAGQSNIGIRVREMEEGVQTMADAMEPNIRIFFQAEGLTAENYPYNPAFDVEAGYWVLADKGENIALCSAIGYTFAYELFYQFLAEGLEVPVAIINTQKGGSSIHSWLSREVIMASQPISAFVLSKGYSFDEAVFNTKGTQNYNQPSALFNKKVAPLFDFNIKGVIWYQGENDPNYDPSIYSIPALIDSWSEGFNQNGELLPFALVNLHPYDATDPFLGESTKNYSSTSYALHRQAQFEIVKNPKYSPTTMVIPIYDISLKWNVPSSQFLWKSIIHPTTKKPVGERIAKAAMTMFYDSDADYLPPLYQSHSYDATSITITFDHVGTTLRTFKDSLNGVTTVEVHLKNGSRQTVTCQIINANQILITNIDTSTVSAFSYSYFIRNEMSNLSSSFNVPAVPFKVNLN
jgi:sialate O-acetylesterase